MRGIIGWADEARTRPLEPEIAREMEAGFSAALANAEKSNFIIRYEEALPWCECPTSPEDRRGDYQRLLKELRDTGTGRPSRTGCRK